MQKFTTKFDVEKLNNCVGGWKQQKTNFRNKWNEMTFTVTGYFQIFSEFVQFDYIIIIFQQDSPLKALTSP